MGGACLHRCSLQHQASLPTNQLAATQDRGRSDPLLFLLLLLHVASHTTHVYITASVDLALSSPLLHALHGQALLQCLAIGIQDFMYAALSPALLHAAEDGNLANTTDHTQQNSTKTIAS